MTILNTNINFHPKPIKGRWVINFVQLDWKNYTLCDGGTKQVSWLYDSSAGDDDDKNNSNDMAVVPYLLDPLDCLKHLSL